jgi:hypothetical protein
VRTAGDPDKEDVFYTHMTPKELSCRLAQMGTPTGRDSIATWLDDAGIRHRQIAKVLAGGQHEDRDAQFVRIGELIEQYETDGNPWFSMDTKAKEHLGTMLGKQRYPDATSILLACNGGGSNSSNKYIFKYDLQQLIESIGLEIRVAHYPPYCSKYNPIERRFFSARRPSLQRDAI